MSPEEYEKGLERLKDELAEIIINAPIVSSLDLNGKILSRVFNNGKDSEGGDIGRYKPGRYIAKRNAAGRRIDKVDLQFTGALFESIKTGVIEDGAVIGFNNLIEGKVADYNEERYGKKIFAPSTEEQEETKTLMTDYVIDELRKKVKEIFANG